jgi:hypothetical protein
MMARGRESEGRYSGGSASVPGELPSPGRRRQMHIVHGIVTDPNPTRRGRQKVAINRNTDALEYAHSRHQVSPAAYAAGRVYQAVLERAAGVRDAETDFAGIRSDPVAARDIAMIYKLESAREAVEMLDETARVVGKLGGWVLEMTLGGQRMMITDLARMNGGGRNAETFYGQTFRVSLENLAEHWAKRSERAPRSNTA